MALTARAQERQDQASRLYAQFARGYEAIVTDPAEAISIFEEIVRAHSTNVIARKQLGSLYIGAGRTEDALEQFRVVDILSPSDTTKLQIAYLLASLGRNGEAQLAFDELTTSTESRIREQASSASAVLAWVARRWPGCRACQKRPEQGFSHPAVAQAARGLAREVREVMRQVREVGVAQAP